MTPAVAARFALHRPARALATAAAQMQLRRMQTRARTASASIASAAVSESDPAAATATPLTLSIKRRSSNASTAGAAVSSDHDDAAPRLSKKAKTPRASASVAAKASKVSKSRVMPIAAVRDSTVDNDGSDRILYTYEHLVPGRLIRRYKRFLADVELVEPEATPSGAASDAVPVNLANVVTVYCPNTGPMVGLLDLPLARVQLSKSADSKRKYAYTLEMIQVDNGMRRVWVGVHSTLANRMVERAIAAQWLPALGRFATFEREVTFAANSRVDFVLSRTGDGDGRSTNDRSVNECSDNPSELASTAAMAATVHQLYVEVKSVSFAYPVASRLELSAAAADTATGATRFCALFPDTVSTRAQKHVVELTALVERCQSIASTTGTGTGDTAAAIVFLVQRDDCSAFAPSFVHDEAFAELCATAAASGVQLLAYAVALEPHETERCGYVRLLHALPLYEHTSASDA